MLIYRNEILPASETFIAAQAGALRRYRPYFAGLKRVPSAVTFPFDPAIEDTQIVLATQTNRIKDKLARRIYLGTGCAPSFHRRVQALKPRLIHAHFGVDGCIALPLARKLRLPLVVTLHGYDVTRSDGALRSSHYGRIYLARRDQMRSCASLFLCVSEHIRQSALDQGFPERKLCVHRIGIDLRMFCPDSAIRREPVVLFVGRLVEKKGCIHLLRAMAKVKAKFAQAQLVVIGDGPLRLPLEAAARDDFPEAQFLGAQSPAEVRHWMRRASVLAAPSIVAKDGDSEGLPTVLCEAQAIGLPVVAFRGPGVAEAVVDGQTALLVPSADDDALSDAILSLLSDHELQSRLAIEGRRHAEKFFDLEKQTAMLEEKYDAVVSGS